MCVIQINVQCSEKFTELMIDDVQDAELIIESIVSTSLLELFDTVCVNNVRLLTSQSTTISNEGEWE